MLLGPCCILHDSFDTYCCSEISHGARLPIAPPVHCLDYRYSFKPSPSSLLGMLLTCGPCSSLFSVSFHLLGFLAGACFGMLESPCHRALRLRNPGAIPRRDAWVGTPCCSRLTVFSGACFFSPGFYPPKHPGRWKGRARSFRNFGKFWSKFSEIIRCVCLYIYIYIHMYMYICPDMKSGVKTAQCGPC